jgi:hypothetical protein
MISRHATPPFVRGGAVLAIITLPWSLAGCSARAGDSEPSPIRSSAARLAAPASSAIRRISERSPYGDLTATRNLALDGDFELEQGAFNSAWAMIEPDGSFSGTLVYASGARCRSGLYCADAPPGQSLLDQYVPIRPGSAGVFTLGAKPAGACSDVHAELDLGPSGDQTVYDVYVATPTSTAPSSDGWCTYEAAYAAERPLYQWTQVLLSSTSETLFDDVVILETPSARDQGRTLRREGEPSRGRLFAAHRAAVRNAHERRAAATSWVLKHRP